MRVRAALVVLSTLVLVGCAPQNSKVSVLDIEQRDTINRMQTQISDLTDEVLTLESELRSKDEVIGIHESTQIRLETEIATLKSQLVMANDIIEDYVMSDDVDSENSSYDVLRAMDHALDFTFDSLQQFEVIPHYEYGGVEGERDVFDAIVLWYEENTELTLDRQLVLIGPATDIGGSYMVHGLEYRSMNDDFRTYDLMNFESLKSVQFNIVYEQGTYRVIEYIDEFD